METRLSYLNNDHTVVGDRPVARATGSRGQLQASFTTRVLFALIIASLPVENMLPRIGPASTSYVLFAIALGHVYATNVYALLYVAKQRVFLALLVFLFVGFLTEMIHVSASMWDLARIASMAAGALVMAAMGRDRLTLRIGLHALIAVGVYLATILFLTSYGVLKEADVDSFVSANRVREQALDATNLQLNANMLATYVGVAAAISLAFGLTARNLSMRALYFGICGYCLVASFLPVSRSGALTVILACLAVGLGAGRTRRLQVLILAAMLGVGVLLCVPNAVWARMTFTNRTVTGRASGRLEDARAQVYGAFVTHAPEFFTTGVGSGNYWDIWAVSNGFTRGHGPLGAHNGLLQATVYWGIGGLAAALLVVWSAWKMFPRSNHQDDLYLALQAISVGMLLVLLSTHVLYDKLFSVGLGLFAGSRASTTIDRPGERTQIAQHNV
jgi:hypothetical protein